MTFSAPARQRKPTLWDSQVALYRRLGFLSCAEPVERVAALVPEPHLDDVLHPPGRPALGVL
jgi:hypothetical protein